jgi:hypothetical protein
MNELSTVAAVTALQQLIRRASEWDDLTDKSKHSSLRLVIKHPNYRRCCV